MKLAILLTATVRVQVVGGNFTVEERVKMYASTLDYYARTIGKSYPIVFLENSDYDLSGFKREFEDRLDIEFIQFKPDGGLPFDPSKGKGYNEYLMIGEGIKQSEKLKSCTHILKITGRYAMLNISSIVREIEKRCEEKLLICDIKDTNLYEWIGSRNEGHWGDSRFWAANVDFYKAELSDCYKWMDDRIKGHFAEDFLYNYYKGHCQDSRFVFRFNRQVRFDGFSGAVASIAEAHGNLNYNSLSSQMKYYIRTVLRVILPNVWF